MSPSWSPDALSPIGLDELATLQDRMDVKYVIDADAFAALADELQGTHRVLEIGGRRSFEYRTTYYDTLDLRAFRDHQQRRRRRYKARSREYVDSGQRTFEVKVKGARGRTIKYRMPYDRDELSEPAVAFLRHALQSEYGRDPDPDLHPALEVVYHRITFAAAGERVTCDRELRFSGGAGLAPGRVIVETKSERGSALADRVLRSLGERPEPACSKYCLGVALTQPRVKHNALRHILRRHFVAAAVPALLAVAPAPAQAELPTLRITNAPRVIPDEKKANATLRMPGYQGGVGIERRGQSSQRFPKKSFSIELRDRNGTDRKVGLLGMPSDGDWVLYSGYQDKTLMRNVVAYATARSMGTYAPRTRYVKLHLNGRYQGIYVLAERVELAKRRVQGKALFEFTFDRQARNKRPSFRGPVRKRPIVWNDPERGDLTRAEASALAAPVRAAERALYGPGSWRPYLDEDSVVDYLLFQELFKNQDAFLASTFLALREDGKLHFGPLWDFDIAMGNTGSGLSGRLEGWILERRHWAGRLVQDKRVARRMGERWRELRAAGLRVRTMNAIDDASRDLRGEVGRNFTRWPILDRVVWPSRVARGSHTAEVRHLRSWLSRRIAWIDRNVERL